MRTTSWYPENKLRSELMLAGARQLQPEMEHPFTASNAFLFENGIVGLCPIGRVRIEGVEQEHADACPCTLCIEPTELPSFRGPSGLKGTIRVTHEANGSLTIRVTVMEFVQPGKDAFAYLERLCSEQGSLL